MDEKPSLTRAERHFIQVQAIVFGGDAISSVFLSLFLFRADGFGPIAKYWIASIALLTVGMIAGGYVLRTRTTRWMIRAGLLLFCVLYATILALGTKAADFPVLLGCINGIALATYWSGINVTEFAVTHEHTRSLYMGTRQLWLNISPTVARIAGGLLLTGAALVVSKQNAYYTVFALLVITYGLAFVHARGIKPLTGVQFRLRDSLNKPPSPAWIPSLISQFFRGLVDVTLLVLAPVLIYLVIDNELAVGTFTGVVTLIGAFTALFAGKLLQRDKRAYLLGAVLTPLSLGMFGAFSGWPGLVGYALLIGFAASFTSIPVQTAIYDSMGRSGLPWQRSFHYFIENEVILNFGRIVSFTLVLLVIPEVDQAEAVRNALIAIALAPIAIGILQHHVNKRLAVRVDLPATTAQP